MTRTMRKRHIFVGVISAFGLLANAAQAQVVCDQFEIVAELNGHNLMMSLNTDLPDETTIMVGVHRNYYEHGSSEEYVEIYYDERSTVGKWRLPRKISVRDEIWTNANRKKQRLFSNAGMPFKVRKISDDIMLSFVVPFPDIRIEEHRRVEHRRVEHRIYLPMGTSSDAVNIKTPVHAYNLKVGKKYVLEHRVPMVPRRDSVEPEDIGQIRQLRKGYVIEILEKDEQRSLYRVKAADQSGREVGSGWISDIALLDQEIWEATSRYASDPGEPREPDNRPLVLRSETGWTRLRARLGPAEVAKLLGEPGVKRHYERLLFWYYPNENGGFVMFLDGLLDSWEPPPKSVERTVTKPVEKTTTGNAAIEQLKRYIAEPPGQAVSPETPKTKPKPKRRPRTKARKWYEGGTLQKKTMADWYAATYRNRLGTSADFAVVFLKVLKHRKARSMDELKNIATALEICISEAGDDPSLHSQKASDMSAMCSLILEDAFD